MGNWYFENTSDEENGILYNPDVDQYVRFDRDFNVQIPSYMLTEAGLSDASSPEKIEEAEKYICAIQQGLEPPHREWIQKWFNVYSFYDIIS